MQKGEEKEGAHECIRAFSLPSWRDKETNTVRRFRTVTELEQAQWEFNEAR